MGLSLLWISGCQVVSVKQQALNVTIANERDSILTRNKLSEASLNVLSMTGREAKACIEQAVHCVAELQQIPQIQDEQLLSTSSEIYLARAMQLGDSTACQYSPTEQQAKNPQQHNQQQQHEQCLDQQLDLLDKSIRYSYAYLFKTKRQPQERIFDNRQVQIRDFYNQAVAKLIMTYASRHQSGKVESQIKVGKSIYNIDFSHFPQLAHLQVEQLLSSYNLNFSGLRSINRRDGFGSEFVVVLAKDQQPVNDRYILDPLNFSYRNDQHPNIHQARYLAATIAMQPKSLQSVEDILNQPEIQIQLYDPYRVDKIRVGNKQYPLAANFSAPYGLWLAQNNLGIAAYLSLIDREKNLAMPHLYMLEPYNPQKKVIVLIHGMASSPEAWIALTNDIMGDQVLREHYQVWQVFYSTNMPMIESRLQIYALLKHAFGQLNAQAPAKQDAVLIGHSMGGIISRLLVSNADLSRDALHAMNARQQSALKNDPMLNERLQIRSIDQFNRAIFLATPHRGTEYAERWFTRAARKIIRLPGVFVSSLSEAIQAQDPNMKSLLQQMDRGLIQNGPSDLSHQSRFIALTQDVMPRQGLIYHSILGNQTDTEQKTQMSDGIVSYQSAHLPGARSEKIFKGGHSIQMTPDAVLELRRILRQHLTELGLYHP
nr:alpha/beta fold hydrolase [Acinetobacter sp. GSS19]